MGMKKRELKTVEEIRAGNAERQRRYWARRRAREEKAKEEAGKPVEVEM